MKRDDLVRRISAAAKAADTSFDLVREGGSHSVFRYGAQQVIIPRHREINEMTARGHLARLGNTVAVAVTSQVTGIAMTRIEEVVMTYTVVARRSGGWWAISVPQLKGVHSQARRLDQVPAMAQEAIALMLDVAPAAVAVEVRPELPAAAAAARKARESARSAERRAEVATEKAVTKLLAEGYTVRDAGRLLDLSPQRISQIAKNTDRQTRPRKKQPAAV